MNSPAPKTKVSICIPVYNGASTIAQLVAAVARELGDEELEFVLVNDASKDNSDAVCRELVRSRQDVTYVALRRNFGEHNAVMCALYHATGSEAVVIDDDFQNPPSQIRRLLVALRSQDVDVVYSRFNKKHHGLVRNLGSRFNGFVAGWLLDKPRGLYLSSFKALSRPLIDTILEYRGPFPYIDGLILRATSRIASVVVDHEPRRRGSSNYTLRKLVNLWLNMFVNFSTKPLRMITLLGLLTAIFFFVLGLGFLVEAFLNHKNPAGWASLIVTILFAGGMQLFFLGLIGEYVGKLYLDVNGTPQWTILDSLSSDNSSDSTSSD